MLIFYGLHKNGLWYVTSEQPKGGAYIVIHSHSRLDAECQLFGMVASQLG